MNYVMDMEKSIKQIIDQLKGLCSQNGLANQASEERVITSIFLYKFLNDKFLFNLADFAKKQGKTVETILENKKHEMDLYYKKYSMDVAFAYEDTIPYLINKSNSDTFYKDFDDTLERISNREENRYFSIVTADGTRKPLFEPISNVIDDSKKKNLFVRNIFSYISQEKFDFGAAFPNKFDFYSAIFEYLIKDYNVASGVYAEYFTPQSVSSIIARILVRMSPGMNASEIYDPSAGSGSLILHLAHELGADEGINRAVVYTQDISNKSTRFLRLNLLLNGLAASLSNVIEGDTLLDPSHFTVEGDPASGLKKFDYITSNPPFKMDFSSTRDSIQTKWEESGRFFAGIPKIPEKKKASMSIYLLFIQHILYSLKPNGKAAVVVPTGFLTAQSGIEFKIREHLIKNKMLKGVVSMPPSIFANTGTNVSVLFFDKAASTEKVIFIDASKLGTKIKDGKNQRMVLSSEEIDKIIETFVACEQVEDFSAVVSFDEVAAKKYSFSAGQYFDVKVEYSVLTPDEFSKKVSQFQETLSEYFRTGKVLEEDIEKQLGMLKYE
ncbi:MAG: N-6 DNA methylase [Methanocorpusculum sp.]|jgi:type I restriction enzyme M protein|nr:N-6 DNA methylase [Methanocorpusculum sp.]